MSSPARFIDTLDHEGRWGEWMLAIWFLGAACIMALPGDTLRYGIYATLRGLGVTETIMTAFFGALGVYIAMSLYVNGMHRRTPMLRGIGSGISAIIFLNLTILSWWEVLSPGGIKTYGFVLVFFPLMLLCAVRGIIRSGRDAAHVRGTC